MAKAVVGAALVVGAVAIGVASGGTLTGLSVYMISTAISMGISMIAGGIAQALSQNRASNITVRQPAANRQIVYGTFRVGGTLIYVSSNGSSYKHLNNVVVVAGHECDSFLALYVNGYKCYWHVGSPGYKVRNGIGFGGDCDTGTHHGADGQKYNLDGLVYAEARWGDQPSGDVITGLTANDPKWAPGGGGSPYVGGCAYFYLKCNYNATYFASSEPEIRITVRGKNDVWDPRTNTYGYTENVALIAADILMNTDFGCGVPLSMINVPNLIMAANLCDEPITLAGGGTEPRYTFNGHFDTAMSPGDMLDRALEAMGGSLSFVGGQYFMFPAADYGVSSSWDYTQLVGDEPFQWDNSPDAGALFNRVRGTYTAPNYPYAVAGNYYGEGDSSYIQAYHGAIQNNFNYEYQPTDVPEYACDPAHGYTSDAYLAEDGNVVRAMNLNLDCTTTAAGAQRLFKIALLRNRMQRGKGRLVFNLTALQLVPKDEILFTFPAMGWTNKLLEVTDVTLSWQYDSGMNAPRPVVLVSVQETDPAIYAWSTTEELTVTGGQATSIQRLDVAQPSGVLLDGTSTAAVLGADGINIPRIAVSFTNPSDALATEVQVQYQPSDGSGNPTGSWVVAHPVHIEIPPPVANGTDPAPLSSVAYIDGVVSGQFYNVRLRTLRSNGATSDWMVLTTQVGAPASSSVGGTFSPRYTQVAADYNATSSDYTIAVDASAGVRTITLPSSPAGNQIVTVRKIDASANAVTVNGSGGFTTSLTLASPSVLVQYTGSGWIAI